MKGMVIAIGMFLIMGTGDIAGANENNISVLLRRLYIGISPHALTENWQVRRHDWIKEALVCYNLTCFKLMIAELESNIRHEYKKRSFITQRPLWFDRLHMAVSTEDFIRPLCDLEQGLLPTAFTGAWPRDRTLWLRHVREL